MFDLFDEESIKKIIENRERDIIETILPKLSDEEFKKVMEFILLVMKEAEQKKDEK